MNARKITVTLEGDLLDRLDELVAERKLTSRSNAVQIAVREKFPPTDRKRFARECRKLDPAVEQKMAE